MRIRVEADRRVTTFHTTVDLIVVDEVTRQPIGRPVLTVAIDIHTPFVAGFYLALNYPSTLLAKVCVVRVRAGGMACGART